MIDGILQSASQWRPAARCLSAVDFRLPIFTRMPLFKKSKKSRQPSQQPMSLGIPTHIAIGALGINAELDPAIGPEGVL